MSSSSFSISSFPDIYTWIKNLPHIPQWKTNSSFSTYIFSSNSSQPSLKLSITKSSNNSSLILSLVADYNLPISLWTSKPFESNDETFTNLLNNFIEDVLNYSPNKNHFTFKLPKTSNSVHNLKEIFNFSFLTLTFIICIYEAPVDLRSACLHVLKNHLACPRSRDVSKAVIQLVGTHTEEQWMRSVHLAITNWMVEIHASGDQAGSVVKTPSTLFSYAVSRFGMWKVHIYCPVIAMEVEKCSSSCDDEKLGFSLNYHQVEGVIQLNYKVVVREKWIDLMVNVDNIRCDVIRLVNETLMKERGAGISEKHFPSRISLQLTPITQTVVLSVSVSKSSDNPTREIGLEKSIEGSFEPPNPYMGIKVSAGETITMSLRPWKFEQMVNGDTASLNWFLHDSVDGREVFSTKPSRFSLLRPNAWFKNRYSNVHRPFTRQGGVIFAGDEYGESVLWKVDKGEMGKTMEWEIRGWIWLTYWPNKHRTFYTETRRLEFREVLVLTLA